MTGGCIGIEDLHFDYGRIRDRLQSAHPGLPGVRAPGVLHGIDLVIEPGERVGLIGPSGAGKSTLVNLLLHFFDPASGRILIDGQDIAHVTQESLRAHIAMVTQDTSLLHRSIRENIRYGRRNATDEEIIEAAHKAEAHDFILGLEDWHGHRGYDAHVGERGVKLSGGQRQRVALARVILKDAPILVLDEATSALDFEVEAAIQGQLDRLMEGRTVIAIAHRLSTIARMDRLIVLDAGRVVESGSHADLLRFDGLMLGCGDGSRADLTARSSTTGCNPPSSTPYAGSPASPAGPSNRSRLSICRRRRHHRANLKAAGLTRGKCFSRQVSEKFE